MDGQGQNNNSRSGNFKGTTDSVPDALLLRLRKLLTCSSPSDIAKISNMTGLIRDINAAMASEDVVLELVATQACRMLMTNAAAFEINTLISAGIPTHCINFLSYHVYLPLQFEASCILDALITHQPNFHVEIEVIQALVELLKSSSTTVAEQAIWTLGTLMHNPPLDRHYIIKQQAGLSLMHIVGNDDMTVNFTRGVVRLLAYIGMTDYFPPDDMVGLIRHPVLLGDDASARLDVSPVYVGSARLDIRRAYVHVAHMRNPSLMALTKSRIVHRLVNTLDSQDSFILDCVLEQLDMIIGYDKNMIDVIIRVRGLRALKTMLGRKEQAVKAALIISKIAGGNQQQIQSLIDAVTLPTLFNLLAEDPSDIRSAVALTVYNLSSNGSSLQISQLTNQGLLTTFLRLFCDLIEPTNVGQDTERFRAGIQTLVNGAESPERESKRKIPKLSNSQNDN